MDKWDELTGRIQQAILAEEPEAAVATGFALVCEFGRTLEQVSADLDRIATTLETQAKIFDADDAGIPPELRHEEPELEHDL
jgi:deferrochelatase/peroxidase EfeB